MITFSLKNGLKTQLRATNGHCGPQVEEEKENQWYEAKTEEKEHIENTYVSVFKKKIIICTQQISQSNLEVETSVILIYIHIYLHLKTQ